MSERDDDRNKRPRRDDDRRSSGPRDGNPSGDRRPRDDDGGARGQRPAGDRPARSDKSTGDRSWSPRPPRGGSDRPNRAGQGRPAAGGYGSGRPGAERSGAGRAGADRPGHDRSGAGRSGADRSGSSRPPRGDGPSNARPPRSGGDRPFDRNNDRPQRPAGDRPYRGDGDRPSRPASDRPSRGNSDRPQRPTNDRGDRGSERPSRPSGGRPGGERPYRGNSDRPRPAGDRENRGSRAGRDPRDNGGQWEDRDPLGLRSVRPRQFEPHLPDEVEPRQLDKVARAELKTLSKENADFVARHLIMASELIEEDPQLAHQHAQAAGRRAGRIAVVRETIAITAYALEDYALTLRELRTYRRISGRNDQLPLMVDSERGLERPDRALELGRSVEVETLDVPVRVSLAIAMSGARLDLKQTDAALRELEIPQLDRTRAYSYSPDLFDAYATVLEELDRETEAGEWSALARRARAALNSLDIEEDRETVEIVEEEVTGFDGDDVALDDELAGDEPETGSGPESDSEPDPEPDREPKPEPESGV